MKNIFTLTVLILLAGCSSSKSSLSYPGSDTVLPVWEVYEGSLPCADCSEIKTHIELFIDPNNAEPPFIIKQAYLGKKDEDQTVADHGLYGTLKGSYHGNDATVYELNPDKPAKKMYFLRVHADTLRMVDQNLNEIKSELNYNLIKTGVLKER